MLEELKHKQLGMAAIKGKDIFDEQDRLLKKNERTAREEFEKFMKRDRVPEDSKALIIDAYENVLYKHRRLEKDLLNRERQKNYEKNRPP